MNLDNLYQVWSVLSDVVTAVVLLSLVVGVILWLRGILPALRRLGHGLAAREIAIFAKDQAVMSSLQDLLHDAKLFRRRTRRVTSEKDLGAAAKATVWVVYWPDWSESIEQILGRKPTATALIVHAPKGAGKDIPPAILERLDGERNVAVNRFRGRLLGDVVMSMITSGHD